MPSKMGVNPKIGGKPPKWMVYFMENPIKMDDLGIPLIFGNTQMFLFVQVVEVLEL